MLVHLLSAGEPPSPRNDQRGVEAKKSVGQESVGPQRPLPRDPGLRGPYADRLVPVRRPGGAPSDRCTTYLPHRRTPRDKRRSHAENDCTSTRKETLIADLQYSASRAGRSAGRSLSWHGRGRGFKSHPVHFIRLVASESRVVCEHQGPRVVRYELEHRSKSEEYEKRPENPKRQLKDPYRISA